MYGPNYGLKELGVIEGRELENCILGHRIIKTLAQMGLDVAVYYLQEESCPHLAHCNP